MSLARSALSARRARRRRRRQQSADSAEVPQRNGGSVPHQEVPPSANRSARHQPARTVQRATRGAAAAGPQSRSSAGGVANTE
eukprot:6075343-Alexandrium_andersonii.AAC.1